MAELIILTPPVFTFGVAETQIGGTIFTPDTTEGPFTVTDATNASPIVVTVSVSHGMYTGRGVTIFGVEGNTAANGLFQIQEVVGQPTKFTLLGSSGNGAYTTGGTVSPGNSFYGGSALGEAIMLHLGLGINEAAGETSETLTSLGGASVY